jgi:hypothetical protein
MRSLFVPVKVLFFSRQTPVSRMMRVGARLSKYTSKGKTSADQPRPAVLAHDLRNAMTETNSFIVGLAERSARGMRSVE